MIGNRVVPCSLAVHNDRIFDLALVDRPEDSSLLIHGVAPRLHPDWKDQDWKQVRRQFPWREPRRELRVRTQIHAEYRRSEDDRLFAQRVVDPTGQVWGGTVSVDVSRLVGSAGSLADTNRKDVLESLLGRLYGLLNSGYMTIGKTKARIRGRMVRLRRFQEFDEAAKSVEAQVGAGEPIVIMLNTSALMINWYSNQDLVSSPQKLTEIYRQTFRELSANYWELRRCFVSHQLVGGFRAWQETSAHGEPYNPMLLTSPGSVFVLAAEKSRKTEAGQCVARWLATGLQPTQQAVLDWVKRQFKQAGDSFPYTFLPQNGYGRIELISDHCQAHRPGGGQVEIATGVIQ